jgi:hypothetical protein
MTTKRRLGSLEDYQAFVSPVAGHCSLLLAEIEMLKPALDNAVRERFHRNGRFLGLHLVTMGLFDRCVIHAAGLLEGQGGLDAFDPQKVRPSLRVLAHPFLEKNEKRCAELLKRLRMNPPSRPELVLHLEGHPRGFRTLRRPKQSFSFEERVKFVRNNWTILEARRKQLDAVRHQLSGHIQTKLQPVELTVENRNWESSEFFVPKKTEIFDFAYKAQFMEVWSLLFEVGPLLSSSIAHLAHILITAELDFDRRQREAARDAAVFWQTQIGAA